MSEKRMETTMLYWGIYWGISREYEDISSWSLGCGVKVLGFDV